MSILVTYGSKRGGTEGLAEMVAGELRNEGFSVDLAPAHAVTHLKDYEAVIVGGSLYASRWNRDATRFVKRNTQKLRSCPTFLFSSGPLGDSTTKKDIPPVRAVQVLAKRIGAREHVTFGGRLTPDAKGLFAHAMAKKLKGDWRDKDQVQSWARHVASELKHDGSSSA